MLKSRLENDMDNKFARFEHDNDRKRREVDVSSFVKTVKKVEFSVALL